MFLEVVFAGELSSFRVLSDDGIGRGDTWLDRNNNKVLKVRGWMVWGVGGVVISFVLQSGIHQREGGSSISPVS